MTKKGSSFEGIVADIVRIGQEHSDDDQKIAEKLAEITKKNGITLREIGIGIELGFDAETASQMGIYTGIDLLMKYGFEAEAGFDRYGGAILIDGKVDFR